MHIVSAGSSVSHSNTKFLVQQVHGQAECTGIAAVQEGKLRFASVHCFSKLWRLLPQLRLL